ncbi:LexA family transcriptional regulator [Campylobacter gastrosuis]|uniref:LexA family transcriptional regulator n=1 Tax=Campylobacter gastrosuis TaxID=2974576 RepID=A0ABT7HUI1_9BACT|nr:LexA family transcriptional regulator [Campylobacter gastrosuis]MDL0090049.1 LexA family transcriptional regulator [Campylobacter gastrosuis]
MSIGSRIKAIRQGAGLSQKEFALKIGVSYGALQSYEYGDTTPKAPVLRSIDANFKTNLYGYFNQKTQDLDANFNKQITLNYFKDVSASAGYGFDNDSVEATKVCVSQEFLQNVLKVEPMEYDIIKVNGDSMEPFIKDGDMVLVQRDIKAKHGDIVIANLQGSLYVKKLLINPINNSVKLTSLNSFYQDIDLSGDELESLMIIGRVKAKFVLDVSSFK